MVATNSIVSEKTEGASWLNGLLLGLLGAWIISIVILSLVPPVSKDALVHHLALPKLYLEHGGIYEIPSMIFSYYPMNLDLLYLIPLYFGNDILPKLIHFSFALLTAWMIFLYLRRRINVTYGLFGVILFLSLPIIIKLSITVYVDLGVIFFSFASILLLFKWLESHFRLRFLILSALSCGLAMGTKYNGLITFFLLTLFVPYLNSKYTERKKASVFKSVGNGLLFLLIALLVFSPWMIRNYNWKGNPIYPLHDKVFNPPKTVFHNPIPPKEVKKVSRGIFTYRSVIYKETWWEIALLPIRIFFQGRDERPQYFDGKLNPFLLFLPVFAFCKMRNEASPLKKEKMIMLAFTILFFSFAFLSYSLRMRYISPIIPPLVILSVFGVEKIIKTVKNFSNLTARRIGLIIVGLALATSIVLNANYLLGQFKYVDPFNYLQGTFDRDTYISKYRFEYPAVQYINKHLSPDALILFIFLGKRGYYCNREYVVSGEFKLGSLIKNSDSPEKILEGLKVLGITHLFIFDPIFKKWVADSLTKDNMIILNEFIVKYVKLLYSQNGFIVLSLLHDSS